jgi:hypothetical protein
MKAAFRVRGVVLALTAVTAAPLIVMAQPKVQAPVSVIVRGEAKDLDLYMQVLDLKGDQCKLKEPRKKDDNPGKFKGTQDQIIYECTKDADSSVFVPFATAFGAAASKGAGMQMRIAVTDEFGRECPQNRCGGTRLRYWYPDAVCEKLC